MLDKNANDAIREHKQTIVDSKDDYSFEWKAQ